MVMTSEAQTKEELYHDQHLMMCFTFLLYKCLGAYINKLNFFHWCANIVWLIKGLEGDAINLTLLLWAKSVNELSKSLSHLHFVVIREASSRLGVFKSFLSFLHNLIYFMWQVKV
jgi:hypothetical protein